MEEIDLYEAIARMRAMSKAGREFRFKFRKYNRATRAGGESVTINAAVLRPAARDEDVANASYKLFFVDRESGRDLNCWQMLVTEFEGRPVRLK